MPKVEPGHSIDAINHAVALLNAGALVGLPTETVYGLAADADNPDAVREVFAAKDRPADHPLIIHLGADDLLPRYARNIPDDAWLLAEAFWPGPLTLILNKAPGVPDVVTGGQDTVGVRVPGHPVALALLQAFAQTRPKGGGLAAPSANRFGRISPTAARDVSEELGDAVSLILDGGDCSVGIESTIVDLSRGKPTILRPGAITAAQLSLVLGKPVAEQRAETNDAPRVSGSLASHYAPRTPLQVIPDALFGAGVIIAAQFAAIVRDCPEIETSIKQQTNVMVLPNEAAGYAHDFYRALRDLDAGNFKKILVQALPQSHEWVAVQDRLQRAAHGAIPESS